MDSVRLPIPPWVTNTRRLGWASRSCCGSHDIILTLFGKFGISVSVSHFHINEYCFSDLNTPNKSSSFSLLIELGLRVDPKETRITPLLASSIHFLRSSGKGLAFDVKSSNLDDIWSILPGSVGDRMTTGQKHGQSLSKKVKMN